MKYRRGKRYPTPREDQKNLQLAKTVDRLLDFSKYLEGNEKFHSNFLILIPLKVPQLDVICAHFLI